MSKSKKQSDFLLDVLTPEGKVFSDRIISMLVQTPKGCIGIEPHHASYITVVQKGDLVLTKSAGKKIKILLADGFLHIQNTENMATILTSSCTLT